MRGVELGPCGPVCGRRLDAFGIDDLAAVDVTAAIEDLAAVLDAPAVRQEHDEATAVLPVVGGGLFVLHNATHRRFSFGHFARLWHRSAELCYPKCSILIPCNAKWIIGMSITDWLSEMKTISLQISFYHLHCPLSNN